MWRRKCLQLHTVHNVRKWPAVLHNDKFYLPRRNQTKLQPGAWFLGGAVQIFTPILDSLVATLEREAGISFDKTRFEWIAQNRYLSRRIGHNSKFCRHKISVATPPRHCACWRNIASGFRSLERATKQIEVPLLEGLLSFVRALGIEPRTFRVSVECSTN